MLAKAVPSALVSDLENHMSKPNLKFVFSDDKMNMHILSADAETAPTAAEKVPDFTVHHNI